MYPPPLSGQEDFGFSPDLPPLSPASRGGVRLTPVEFHVQLSQNDTWSMSRLHFHDYYELLLPLTSSGNIFVNDQVYPLQRGHLYLISENTLHRTIVNGVHSRYVLHIGRKALSQLSTPQTDFIRLLTEPFRATPLEQEQFDRLIERFEALNDAENDGSFGSDLRQTVCLIELLLSIVPILKVPAATETTQNKIFVRIAPILDYIQENLTESLT